MHADSQRVKDLIPVVYDDLRKIAGRFFRQQPAGFTLQPTELVNEACIHLIQHGRGPWKDPQHFRAIAARKIWQIVVDRLRAKGSLKRGGSWTGDAKPPAGTGEPDAPEGKVHEKWHRIPIEAAMVEWQDQRVELLDLAEAIERLRGESGRLYDVVMLHWFGGMKYADVATALGVSASTVEKDFRYALAWLNRELTSGTSDAH